MRKFRWAIWAVSAVISVAWYWEARTCGVCYISRHLAPVAIVGNLVWPFLFASSRRRM